MADTSCGAAAGRLAFSVENILAPGKFGRELGEAGEGEFGECGDTELMKNDWGLR